jgi:hypothetical protein
MKTLALRTLIFAAVLTGASARSSAGVILRITVAPPPLRVYVQPPCPAEGYIWTPGYWKYTRDGYIWIPGAWVQPPELGFLFTPGYWEFVDGAYMWHHSYWGPHVGYYGGVNYGFGYPGDGFFGGRWEGGHFFYNREASNAGERFHYAYREKVVDHGRGGASFHDAREDRHDGRRADRGDHRKEDRRDDRKDARKEHADSRSQSEPAKKAEHAGTSTHGEKSEHHTRG